MFLGNHKTEQYHHQIFLRKALEVVVEEHDACFISIFMYYGKQEKRNILFQYVI